MSEIGEIIGKLVNRVNKLEEKTQKKGSINTQFTTNYFKIMGKVTSLTVEYKDDTGYSVVGHPVLGKVPFTVGGNTTAWTEHYTITTSYTLTNTAREQIAKLLNGEVPNLPTHVAWGSNSGTYIPGQISLHDETRRLEATTSNGGDGIYQIQVEFYPDNTSYTVNEIGVFDANSDGNMWFRLPIPTLNVTANLRTRITLNITFTDESDVSSASLITTYGLNHIVDCLVNGTAIFDYTEWSDGTSDPLITNTSLDGANKDRNQISVSSREGKKVERVTVLGLSEFNDLTMNKIGNFVLSTGDNLVTETLLPEQTKRDTFKIRNTDIFDIVTDYVPTGDVFPMKFPIRLS